MPYSIFVYSKYILVCSFNYRGVLWVYFLIKNRINSTTAPGAPVDPLVEEINRERQTPGSPSSTRLWMENNPIRFHCW